MDLFGRGISGSWALDISALQIEDKALCNGLNIMVLARARSHSPQPSIPRETQATTHRHLQGDNTKTHTRSTWNKQRNKPRAPQ